jgi:hypothetical protein
VLHGSLRHALRDAMARVRVERPRSLVSKDAVARPMALSLIGPEGYPQIIDLTHSFDLASFRQNPSKPPWSRAGRSSRSRDL